jgi:hypothetical protein
MALFNKPEPSRRVDNPARAVAAIIDPEPSVVLVDDRDAALKAIARKILTGKRRLVDGVLALGESLQEARDLFGDGDAAAFFLWVRKHCEIYQRSARRYLAAYARVGSVATVAKRRFDLTAVHLSGPDGNAFAIMGLVRRLLKQMGEDPAPILEEMRSGDYDHLLEVAEDAVGDFVIFYR